MRKMYQSQHVILLFLLTAADAEWFNKTESDATVSFFISTYTNLNKRYTYSEARTFCKSQGGSITSVLSKEEEDIFLWRFHTHLNGYFIGLKVHYTDVDSTPGFSWDDGSPYNYSNWDASENFDNLCTAYVYNDMFKTWNWKTSHCESRSRFCMCKRSFSAKESVTTATIENVQIKTTQDATTLPEFIEHSTSHVLKVTSVDIEETTSYLYGVNDNDILKSVNDDGFLAGIGVGLGVGILIVIVIIAIFVIILKRKDRSIKGVEEVSAGTSPQYDDTLVPRTNVQSSNEEENHAYVEIENAQENTGNETTTQAYEALPNIINERTYQEYEQISNLQRHNVTCTDRY